MDAARTLIREPDVSDAAHYRRRVVQLAAIYLAVSLLSLFGIGVLLFHGRLFVTLSQRSNVETLTIAFFLLFFAYLAMLSARGAVGAARIAGYRMRARWSGDRLRVEAGKIAALGKPRKGPAVAVNLILEREDRPGEAFELDVADAAGSAGRIRVDGARIEQLAAHRHGSNNLLSFFVRQVSSVAGTDPDDLEIVQWKSIADEAWYQYVASVDAMRLLGHRLGGKPMWPRLTLSPEQCAELERRLGEICGAVREEALLPELEYEGEHKIPIIPEPLGIISLGRRERRVDPLSSMMSALLIVSVAVALMVWLVVRPPWVPGS
jgi:hypothetical protein